MLTGLTNKRFTLRGFSLSAAYACVVILVFTVIFQAFVLKNAFYVPMIAVMATAPILLLTKLERIDAEDLILAALALGILFSALTHRAYLRVSTVAFSLMFIVTCAYFKKLLPVSGLSVKTFDKLLSVITVAYGVVLLIQQICALSGLPIFNLSYGNLYEESLLKQGSLAMEASNSGPILTLLMYARIRIREIQYGRKYTVAEVVSMDAPAVIAYSYVCLATMSVSCLVCFVMMALYLLPRRRRLLGIAVLTVFLVAFISLDTQMGIRIRKLLPAILSLDPVEIYKTDSSAAARVAPYLMYILDFSPFSFDTWFGHGCDYGGLHVLSELSGFEQEESFGVGGIINFFYDYGLLAGLLFVLFLIKACGRNSYLLVLYIVCFLVYPFNTYVTWLFFLMAYSIRHYSRT